MPHFPDWATLGAKVIAGDFDSDGKADLALTGGFGWITIALAISSGGGNFTAANLPINGFPGWSGSAKFALTGSFQESPALHRAR